MLKISQAFAKEEGYGQPNTIPTVRNNPVDLRHSPHSQHSIDNPNGIGFIDTIEHGWEDADRQFHLFVTEAHTDPRTNQMILPGMMTLEECVYIFAPPSDNNRTEVYLTNVCMWLGVERTALVKDLVALG